jgi:TonB-linked SusC/RagA family outer membrane protein
MNVRIWGRVGIVAALFLGFAEGAQAQERLLTGDLRLASGQPIGSTGERSSVAEARSLGTGDVLQWPARLSLDRVPLSRALVDLHGTSGVPLVFSPSLVPDVEVTCDCVDVPVAEALRRMMAGTGMGFSASGRQVVVTANRPLLLAPISSLAMPTALRAPSPRQSLALRVPEAVVVPRRPPAQETGVTGLIRDQVSGAPLASVQVSVPQLNVGVLTGANGRYTLSNIPPGTHTISVARIGYSSETADVTIAAGETVVLDFFLGQQVLQLDQLVVTGTAASTRVREIGNAVARLDATVAEVAPIANVSDLLRGRVAGVVVQQGSGAAGTASAIKIRGSGTMRLVNDGPLLYIDGVRVNNATTSSSTDVSRINDLDPGMIESIEVIKGPAAATLYGTEAANGVIQITTKAGAVGDLAMNVTVRQGANWFHDIAGRTPTNYWRNPTTGQIETLNIMENEQERDLLFRTGRAQYYGIDASGGTGALQYFLSGSIDSDEGATFNSWVKRYNGRVNVTASPGNNLVVDASTGFSLSRLRLPSDFPYDDAVYATPEHLNDERRGYRTAPPEARYAQDHDFLDANRITAGLTVSHNPFDWLAHRLTFGLDVTEQTETQLNQPLGPEFARFFSARSASGSKTLNRQSVLYSTFDYGASATRPLSETLVSTTSAGFQVYTRSSSTVTATGNVFPALGLSAVTSTSERSGSDSYTENNTVGVYLQQQFSWRDRMFVTAAVRADDNSSFGEEFDLVYYPKVSGSWVVSDESFWGLDFVDQFRVRAAYGQSGQQPDAFDAFRTFSTRASPEGSATVFPAAPGNAELGPERGIEIEAGFDASFVDDRVTLEVTYYDQTTKDAIVARNVAPSSGFLSNQFVNIGEINNRGFEVGLSTQVIAGDAFGWDLALALSTNRNRVVDLGLDGFLSLGWVSRHAEGYPVGSLFAPRVIEATLDPDGQVRDFRCDNGEGQPVTCNEDAWIFQGHPDPNYEGSLTSTVQIGERFSIQALVQGKIGQHKYNLQEWWRRAAYQQHEMNVSPEKYDVRDVAEAQHGNTGEFASWVNEASFVRFRELSLSYSLPNELAARIGATRGTISLAARNPFGGILWTAWPDPYHDPEVVDASTTFSGNREPQEDAAVPPLTSLVFSVRLGF